MYYLKTNPMKKLFPLLLAVAILGACTLNKQTTKDVKQYSIEQFMSSVNNWGGKFTPNEKNILVTSNSSGIYNAYLVSVDGGEPVALTQSEIRILYEMAEQGNCK